MLQEVFGKNPGQFLIWFSTKDPYIIWKFGSKMFFVASFAEKVTSLAEIVEKTKAEVPMRVPEALAIGLALSIIVLLFLGIRAALGW